MGADTLHVRWNGGGGYGDPLDRETEAVLADVAAGRISAAAARDLYAVLPDPAATAALRRQLRSAHATGGPCLCHRPAAWKDGAALDEQPLRQAAGAAYDTGFDDVLLRRFHCPADGRLLDAETALPGEPFLEDRLAP